MTAITTITADNLETVRETLPNDLCEYAVIGAQTWGVSPDQGALGYGTMLIVPDPVQPGGWRGAICLGGNSSWGDWSPTEQTLTLDETNDNGDPIVYDADGAQVVPTPTYPVVIVEAGDSYITEIDRLDPVATLDEAKQAARDAGYTVIDDGEGGQCETNNTWADGEMMHLVTVNARA